MPKNDHHGSDFQCCPIWQYPHCTWRALWNLRISDTDTRGKRYPCPLCSIYFLCPHLNVYPRFCTCIFHALYSEVLATVPLFRACTLCPLFRGSSLPNSGSTAPNVGYSDPISFIQRFVYTQCPSFRFHCTQCRGYSNPLSFIQRFLSPNVRFHCMPTQCALRVSHVARSARGLANCCQFQSVINHDEAQGVKDDKAIRE